MEIRLLDPPSSHAYKNKNWLAPQWPFRLLICGPSGSGKSNQVTSLVLEHLYYDRIYWYGRHLDEPRTEMLQQFFAKVAEHQFEQTVAKITAMAESPEEAQEALRLLAHEKGVGELSPAAFSIATFADTIDDVVPVDQLDPELQNLIIFDDFLLEKNQTVIEEFFVRGRHANCSTIYLSQSYYQTPKLIRRNISHLALYALSSKKEARMVTTDHALTVSDKELLEMYKIDRYKREACLSAYRYGHKQTATAL